MLEFLAGWFAHDLMVDRPSRIHAPPVCLPTPPPRSSSADAGQNRKDTKRTHPHDWEAYTLSDKDKNDGRG